ncbi:MAG TPA: ribbon-helix-helix protein, CopG family [Chloroflexota bacterium]|jgi:predicted DNA-binding protein
MLSIQLDSDLERRLSNLAKRTGQATSDVARELIEQGLEGLEDIEMAAERLEKRQPPLTTEQARKALGLEH